MPQFDSSIFLSELFYLFLIFFVFYFYLSIFNKAVILRASFFRKVWLFFLIFCSKSLILEDNKKLHILNIFYCRNKLFSIFKNKLTSIINSLNYIKLEFEIWFDFLTYIFNIKTSFLNFSILSYLFISLISL